MIPATLWLALRISRAPIDARYRAMGAYLDSDPPTGPARLHLLALIESCLKLPQGSIGETSDMHNTPRWDSLRHILLIARIEQHYDIAISNQEIVAATSVAKLRQLLRE